MDSHLIAGAYFQHFQQTDEISLDSDRLDAITKAKRLSQETNKRRKLQAHKRHLQAKREEQRRHAILTRRKEEQRLATEKYQRSHLPPSARQNYKFTTRTFGGATLDTALQLISGGISYRNRPVSSHERILSLANENVDVSEYSFNKLRPHSTRPGTSRLGQQLDPSEKAELMNYSKQNLIASKSLFDQQLEQQQSFLQQQQQHLQEFSSAVHDEIYGRKTSVTLGHEDGNYETMEKIGDMTHSDSCSSLDSLDSPKSAEPLNQKFSSGQHLMTPSRHKTVNVYHGSENDINIERDCMDTSQHQNPEKLVKQKDNLQLQQEQQNTASLGVPGGEGDQNNSRSKNTNSFTLPQRNAFVADTTQNETGTSSYINVTENQRILYVGAANDNDALRSNKMMAGNYTMEQKYQLPLKQLSTDSLESSSASSKISMLKLQGATDETTSSSPKTQLQSTGHENIFPMSKINNNGVARSLGTNLGITKDLNSESNLMGHKVPPHSSNIQAKLGQVAWVSPSSQVDMKDVPASGNERKQINEYIQSKNMPDLSSWPSSSVQSQMPTSVVNTNVYSNNFGSSLISVTLPDTFPTLLPDRLMPNSSVYTLAGSKMVETAGTVGDITETSDAVLNINTNNFDDSHLNIMDSTYPLVDSQEFRNIISSYNHKQVQMYNNLPQTNIPANNSQSEMGKSTAAGRQPSKESSTLKNVSSTGSLGVNSVVHNNANYYKKQANDNSLTSTEGRVNFPSSRPPSPDTATPVVMTYTPFAQNKPKSGSFMNASVIARNTSTNGINSNAHNNAEANVEEDVLVDEDSDDMRPLRGILKSASTRNIPHHQENAAGGRSHVRDSLELTRLHNNKKSKKKSVRFASNHDEDDNVTSEDKNCDKQNDMSTGLAPYKNATNRPLSAKSMPANNFETNLRVQRAQSAGPNWQQPIMSEHVQIRNVQLMPSSLGPAKVDEAPNVAYTSMLQQRSNLPTSYVNPLSTTPIHRPKAAAHIIMSTDNQKEASKGPSDIHTGSQSAHRPHLETKIRSVSNNFMSRVPVKIPIGSESSTIVYNAAYTNTDGTPNSYSNKIGAHAVVEDSVPHVSKQSPQQQNYDKPRQAYPVSKQVSFSTLATTTSTLPVSSKATYTPLTGGITSFSTINNNSGYEHDGIRVDRTPTDDEITRLWDKVRTCLSRENGSKSYLPTNSNSDLGSRQPPTLSTKLIDGTTLECGVFNNGASEGNSSVRAGSGLFQPQATSVTNPSNSGRTVLQQGSYLRRYSLLKQRRASSASSIRNINGSEGQRTGGVVYGRNLTAALQQTASAGGQQHIQDRPMPMAFSYRPQEEVSESTAEFLMAERLAKQSLSDSQIQMALEDAQSKQESYNRSKMALVKNGHSALSIEEQRLLESLDKLNEKLKEQQHLKSTINHSQTTQAHFPGFQGHRPFTDARRHMLMLPGMQQRAQSARTKQQTYLYR